MKEVGAVKSSTDADRKQLHLLVTRESISSARIRDRIAQLLPSSKKALLHVELKQTDAPTNTNEQQQYDEHMVVTKLWHLVDKIRDLELVTNFKPSEWTQRSSGFEKAVWDFKAPGFGATVYRSATLTHAISVVQQIKVMPPSS
jgi:hypothetical protein